MALRSRTEWQCRYDQSTEGIGRSATSVPRYRKQMNTFECFGDCPPRAEVEVERIGCERHVGSRQNDDGFGFLVDHDVLLKPHDRAVCPVQSGSPKRADLSFAAAQVR
jgi:hypothetical protein